MTRAAVVLALVVTAISTGARAHDVDPDVLILQGLELRRSERSVEALELFRRAHQEAPSPRTLGQMGLVETSLAHWMEAENHLAASLATPDDSWVHKNHPLLETALDRAGTHIGEIVITGRPGPAVFLGGKACGVLPLAAPVRLVEGDLDLKAAAANFKPFSVNVSIKGGARTAVTIVLEPVDVSPPISADVESFSASKPSRNRARLGTGAGLAAAGVGALVWGVVWIEIDNRGSCGSQSGGCGTAYATRTPGWILAASGSALALAGGAALLSAMHAARADLALGITPQSLLFQARF